MVIFVEMPLGNDDTSRSLCKDESRNEVESNGLLIEEECITEEAKPIISTSNKQLVDTTFSNLDIDSNTNADNVMNNLNETIRAVESERLDVSKFVLVLLVVIGHFIEPYYRVGNKVASILMHLIYSFHVPTFVYISGYTSGDYFNTKERRRKLISSLLLPYLILQPLFCIWYDAVMIIQENDMHDGGKEDVSSSDNIMMFTPNWMLYNQQPGWSYFYPFAHLWYLISLLTMRIWRPFALEIRYTIIVHVLFGCLVGYSTSTGRFLSLHRTVVLMPYFLCGYIMKQKKCFFPYASSTQARILLLMTMFLLKGAAISATLLNIPVEIWFQSDPYATIYKDHSMYGGLFQLGCYAWTSVAMVAFFALIPPPSICGVQYTAVENNIDCDLGEIDERDTSCGYAANNTSSWRNCCIINSLKNRRRRPGQAAEKEQQSFLARVYLRLAKWGQRSLYAYILHMAVLVALVQFGYYDSLWTISAVSDHLTEANEWKTTLQVLGTVVLSCALTVTLLLRTCFPTFLKCVLEPDVEHIYQEDVDAYGSAILERRDQKDVPPTEGV